MYPGNQIPVVVLHVLEADIPENTSIVNENIHASKVLNRGIDDGLAVLDTVVVSDRLSASGADLLDDNICGLGLVSRRGLLHLWGLWG